MELGEGAVGVEPVEGLGHGDERNARVAEACGGGLACAVLRLAARRTRLAQHVLVRVDADDIEPPRCQEAGQDPGPAPDVGDPIAREDAGSRDDPVDDGVGIRGPEARVARRRAGETGSRVDLLHCSRS